MKACIQRVRFARVEVEGKLIGEIQKGLLVLLGVQEGDQASDLNYLVDKTVGLRIFPDDEGKMNRSVLDVGGQMLVVSQFTLLGDCRKGKRPSFGQAANAEVADALYRRFVKETSLLGVPVATGQFQADMQVTLCNDGPVTILLDSRR
jgi:D-tyrosyl-tRNA(Tyr) deacylase